MKIIQWTNQTKNILFALMCAAIVFFFSSCTSKGKFLTSSVIPAARGTVSVKSDKNNNYVIHVELEYLAEATRLQPSKKTYVVWMVTENNKTQNIGQMEPKNLKGSLVTVSSFKPTKIYLTAEDDANIQYPGSQVVLTSEAL